MIKLGEYQNLKIVRNSEFGMFLNTEDEFDDKGVLLPNRYVDPNWEIGDFLDVFIYKDSKDRLVATTEFPKITLGQIELLEVVETTEMGAFLDWGLDKDLFLPFKEQTREVFKGESYPVILYIDKSDRLCVSMDLYNSLESESPYKIGDSVKGIIYMIKEDMGAFVAIDNKFHGMIAIKELYGEYGLGKEIDGRVINVREDGKLDLSIRKEAHLQMGDDAELILFRLSENNGRLEFNDKTDPKIIKEEFNLSKRAFKRAIGKLMKEKKIVQDENGIVIIKENKM